MIAQISDDDGVLVVASASAMKRRFAGSSFDYQFPKELLTGARAEELCAWQTEAEGDATLSIVFGEAPPSEARFVGVVRFDAADELLLLPYSQYTMACDARAGEPENIEGLCARVPIEPGRLACWVRLRQESPTFEIYWVAARANDKPLTEIPTLKRGG